MALLGSCLREDLQARGTAPRLLLGTVCLPTGACIPCDCRSIFTLPSALCCDTCRGFGGGFALPLLFGFLLLLPFLLALRRLQLSITLPLLLLILCNHVLAACKVSERLVRILFCVPADPLDLVLRLGFATTHIFLPLADDPLRLVDVLSSSWVKRARGRALATACALRQQRLGRRARLDRLRFPSLGHADFACVAGE